MGIKYGIVLLALLSLFFFSYSSGEKYLDLVFVLDGSTSVTRDNFELVKSWAKQVSSHFNISNDVTRIGVVQYSHYYINRASDDQNYMKTEIELGSTRNQAVLKHEIDLIEWSKYTTYTAHALNKTVNDFMSSDRFTSNLTIKVLVLLTDGAADDAEYLKKTSAYVKSMNIQIFVIGIMNAKRSQLKMITANTDLSKRLFFLKNFTDLVDNVKPLVKEIKNLFLDGCVSNPCKSNGTCVDRVQSYQCNCLPGFTGKSCEIDIDDCNSMPCQNNGTGVDLINDFNCTCLPTYAGKTCSCAGNNVAYSLFLTGLVVFVQLSAYFLC